MVTKHRRPIITARDTEAMILTRIGSGANLIGYYMYHGGTNPEGKLTTLQESIPRDWCDLPIKTYDFQGALGEYGMPHECYRALKLQHIFLKDFGASLAPTDVYFPEFNPTSPDDINNLRMSVRYKDNSGFIFVNNHQRHLDLTDKHEIELDIELDYDNISFPKFDLLNHEYLILPFNLKIGDSVINYATAQPLCIVNETELLLWNFSGKCDISINEKNYKLTAGETLESDGITVILLSRADALNTWKISDCGAGAVVRDDGIVIKEGNDFFAISCLEFTRNTISFSENMVRDNGDIFYEFKLDFNIATDSETFLEIDYDGNIANLFLGDNLIADNFYTGLPWRVGLRRFAQKIENKKFVLQVKPLRREDDIYFEIEPKFEDGVACKLNALKVVWERKKVAFGKVEGEL